MSAPVIGIDLGTTYSCVAVVQNGKVEVIANDQGNRTTPSCVAFTDIELLVGEAAKNQAFCNLKNTVFGVKRIIGRKFDDLELQRDIEHWPFNVIDDKGNVKIEVKYKGKMMQLLPEEISAMVLMTMKKTAETYLGKTVKDAVITVPAYFNNSQRQATKNAGTIAGLNVIRIINEPTAAALAFGLDKRPAKKQRVLVFDLGGGTFDVSVISVIDNDFEVYCTAGDTHLGGDDFDNLLVDHFVTEFKRKHMKDLKKSPLAMLRLKTECEKAKRALSKCSKVDIMIHALYDGISLSSSITKARFGEMCAAKFQDTIDIIQKTLADVTMDKFAIDEVVLVGGSTRIPKIRKMVERFFDGKQLNLQVHADEAVACGAAIQAAALSGEASPGIDDLLLLDVLPFSLGTDVTDGRCSKLIERNSRIPICRDKIFRPTQDYQSGVHVGVYEGEERLFRKNHLLGEFTLDGLTPAPSCEVKVIVTFDIDADGILDVNAKEMSTGHSKEIMIQCRNFKSPEDIQRSQMIVACVAADSDEVDEKK